VDFEAKSRSGILAMPLLTSLKCPDCGEITQTAQAVRPGDNVPCEHCGQAIAIRPARREPVQEAAVGGSLEPDLLRELLAGEESPPGAATSNPAKRRYGGLTNQALSADTGTDPPFVRNPLAPASARSKDQLIGGKGVRFIGPREFMAVVIFFGVAAVGNGVFWGLHGVVKETEKAGDRFAEQKKKGYNPQLGPGAKKSAKGTVPAPAPSEGETRTEAGTPQRIGVTEVSIVSATRALPGANGPGGLTLRLRITNHDAKPITYYKKQLTLRDRGIPPKDHPLLEPPAENPKVLPGAPYDDVLMFGPTSMMSILDLDLPASGSDEEFHFFIPTQFIKTGL
jgi:hypothetical protein